MESRISIRLKTLRKQLSFSAKQVIKKLNKFNFQYSVPSLYKWEEGSATPPLDVLKALSKIYNCNISYLIDGNEYEFKRLTTCESKLLNNYRTNYFFRTITRQIVFKLNSKK